MDPSSDQDQRQGEPGFPASQYGIWAIAIVACIAIVIVAQGGLGPSSAIAAIGVVLALAWYLNRRASITRSSLTRSEPSAIRSDDEAIADIVASLPDPTILLDADGRVVTLNSSAVSIAPALKQGEPATLALRIPEVLETVRRVAISRKPERAEFAERVPPERWFEVYVTPVPARDGRGGRRSPWLLLTFRDLTPIRRVEEMRVDFVANASHELRTPLAALSGFIETLKGPARNDTAARERFLDIMEAQAKRMARLIDDLLSLSRIELAAHVRPETPVELVPIVRQVVDALQMLARDRGVTVTIKAPKQPLIVSGDRDELTRVFENLIENALKYGASGKRVEITLSRAFNVGGGEEALVAVRDYGPGIPAEHLPRLTERFYRVDITESREQGGTGLGLALVKHIMNRHRGRLTIESRPGEGATFTVRLPMSTATSLDAVIIP
jgi:two-component system phosphate regulon sensor histidine kinase PhoR